MRTIGATSGLALVVGALVLVTGEPTARAEDQRCKGTKQFYAGKCRYPDEIARMREEQRQQKEAADAARKKAEEEKAAKERARADLEACEAADAADTLEVWRKYLETQRDGSCVLRAQMRVEALEAEQQAAQKAAADAAAVPPPPPVRTDEPSDEEAGWTPTTLFWIGLGVTAAGAITWGVAGGILTGKSSDLEEQCPNNQCPADRQSDLDSAEITAHVTTVGAVVTGVGGALLLAGALWPLIAGDAESADALDSGDGEGAGEISRVRVAPLVGGPFVGLQGVF